MQVSVQGQGECRAETGKYQRHVSNLLLKSKVDDSETSESSNMECLRFEAMSQGLGNYLYIYIHSTYIQIYTQKHTYYL